MTTRQRTFLTGRHFLWLGLLAVASFPAQRADAAFASAETQAEFNIVYADYVDCTRGGLPRQCWNLHLDPFAIGEAIVRVQFETDAVATNPDAIQLTGLNQYQVDPAGGIENLGKNISELHSILVFFPDPGIPPEGNVEILDLSFEVAPGFNRESATFNVLVDEAVTVDLDTGQRTFLEPSAIGQPGPVTIPVVPEPSTFSMLAVIVFGLIPLRRALVNRRAA